MKKDKSLIPKGMYCYSGSCAPGSKTFKLCPYWSQKENRPDQEDGYCAYLGKGDWEINREPMVSREGSRQADGTYKYRKVKFGPKNPSWFSLLWDQCKDVDCPKYE